MLQKKVAVLIGSLRKESFTRKLAKNLIALAPRSLAFEIVELGSLQMYNQDLEENVPQAWSEFRERVHKFDGLLFCTPEYNRSVPAVLKNAIDVGSRPPAASVWNGKPAAIVSVSPGAMGGFGANHHLRQSLICLNVPTMAGPEAYVGNAAKLFDEAGQLNNDSTKEFLTKFMESFDRWIYKF